MAKLQEWIPHIDEKKGMTTWVWKCMVTELSECALTECMPTRPDGWNKLRDTGYNCYTIKFQINMIWA
jgi:hypothetical protein